MIANSVKHVARLKVPNNHSTDALGSHLLSCGKKCARFGNRDLADSTFMTLKVCVLLLLDTLDDNCAPHRPNEVHIGGVDHHTVLVRRIESDGRADPQVLRGRDLLLSLNHFGRSCPLLIS